jgi:hypothetical protein
MRPPAAIHDRPNAFPARPGPTKLTVGSFWNFTFEVYCSTIDYRLSTTDYRLPSNHLALAGREC